MGDTFSTLMVGSQASFRIEVHDRQTFFANSQNRILWVITYIQEACPGDESRPSCISVPLHVYSTTPSKATGSWCEHMTLISPVLPYNIVKPGIAR